MGVVQLLFYYIVILPSSNEEVDEEMVPRVDPENKMGVFIVINYIVLFLDVVAMLRTIFTNVAAK